MTTQNPGQAKGKSPPVSQKRKLRDAVARAKTRASGREKTDAKLMKIQKLSGWTNPSMSAANTRLPPRSVAPLRSVAELKAIGFEVIAKDTTGDILVYGDIGDSFWTKGVTTSEFAQELKKLKGAKTINVRFDSDGGDVFQAETMYSMLRAHGARIVSHIDGHAASAASFLAMAGDEIVIAEPAFIMIHNASGGIHGGTVLIRAYADLIDRVSEKIAKLYSSRTKQKIEKVREWMAAAEGFGTWFDAEQSIEFGFADRMVENLKVAANIRHRDWFPNLPTALLPRRAAALATIAHLARK